MATGFTPDGRDACLQSIASTTTLTRHTGYTPALLLIHIDRLDIVIEGLGHAAADLIVREIAARVVQAALNPDSVFRIDDRQFAIVIDDVASTGPQTVADRVLEATRAPFCVDGHGIRLTVSIGIAVFQPGMTPEEMLRRSAVAMRQARNGGRDRWAYAHAGDAHRARHRLGVEQAVRDAVAYSRVEPWFQPIVDLNNGRIVGYEALARCWREDGSTVPPADFIPTAEESDLIIKIDQQILFKVLTAVTGIDDDQFIGVNVSIRSLTSRGYTDWLLRLLSSHPNVARRLHLEVTETSLLNVDDGVRDAMVQATALGVKWYADDFGTGYSSLLHLRDLPITGLKLDLSFTRAMKDGDERSINLGLGIWRLANEIGIDTVAEGVDSEAVAELLRKQGWAKAQGWLYGAAAEVPADTLETVRRSLVPGT